MVADVQPTSFLLHLPLGECTEFFSSLVSDTESSQGVARSAAISLDVSTRPGRRGWSLVSFASLLSLGDRFPRIKELYLSSVAVHSNLSPGALAHHLRFSWLESLTVSHWSARLPGESTFTGSLLDLVQHMPRLVNLRVYSPTSYSLSEPANSSLQYPELPFSLTQFICLAALPVPACAHIISRSRDTLEELQINLMGDDDALLVSAIAQAAPRLRTLNLGLRLRAESVRWTRVESVFAALARVEDLSLETPQELEDTLDLLAGLGSIRELNLWCTFSADEDDRTSAAATRLRAYLLRTPCLRSVVLHGFDIGNKDRDALLDLCRARRVACFIND